MIDTFTDSMSYTLIYVFSVDIDTHKDALKIGETTIKDVENYKNLTPNCKRLNEAAKKRINEITGTAGLSYNLLYTELAVFQKLDKNKKECSELSSFNDKDVHNVLQRSGIKRKKFNIEAAPLERYITDLETVKNAIAAVKEGKSSLNTGEISTGMTPISFRPEQEDAINKTIKSFENSSSFLWNAKMRFGKTLSTLELIKRMKFKKTIIITHRPVVEEGWFEDFKKIFYDTPYEFASVKRGNTFNELKNDAKNFIYFASMQDLRGSIIAGGNFDKNNDIFNYPWDFVIVDEAHEGTETDLGKAVLECIKHNNLKTTYSLELSGTPFNIIENYKEDEIYTWDYIMEQEAKSNWDFKHFGESNPYKGLPKMNIFTYHLEETIKSYIDIDDKAFNFKEFFRVYTGNKQYDGEQVSNDKIGTFIHEKDVKKFLDLICKTDENTNYPFSNEEYREFFRHSLWVVPGVKEARALSILLRQHNVFKNFDIVNVAGEGDEEESFSNALISVRKAITKEPYLTRSITITCGRLTTGVTVPEWTAVLMLYGSYISSASQYLQTIFRVQSPATINGKIKDNCYVFDFAPDRTLKMIADAVQLSTRAGASNITAKESLLKFLNFCPVISFSKTKMIEYKVDNLLQELKKAYAEKVARNGFDDNRLYNEELLKLDELELNDFNNLKKIIGSSNAAKTTKNIDINAEGFTNEEIEREIKLKKIPCSQRTSEELEELKKAEEKRKNRNAAISILRGISIRIPLLIYGMDKKVDEDISFDSFNDKDVIDDISWNEFMPNGVTREIFNKFSKYYDKDIFIAAGKRIRRSALAADELEPTERVSKIASIFATFKNPDKETVLTPWKVVNRHMADTLGGYCFYDEKYETILEEPRYVEHDEVTQNVFSKDSNILEMNSKTGLYPLYVTYSIYRNIYNDECKKLNVEELSFIEKQKIWDSVVINNVFVICKTPMAKLITKRTLIGYRNEKVNTRWFEDLINQLKQENKLQNFVYKMKQGKSYWKAKETDEMKFNAIVGNPPYQLKLNNNNEQQNVTSIYQLFVQAALKIEPNYISMIIPSRWMTGGRGLEDFRKQLLNKNGFQIFHDFINARECFPNVEIKGGICYFLSSISYNKDCNYYLHLENNKIEHSYRKLDNLNIGMVIRDNRVLNIVKKVINSTDFISFENISGSQTPFGIVTSFKDFTNLPTGKNTIKIYGNKFIGFTSKENILKNESLAYKYKVFVPKAVGDGLIGTDRIKPIVPDLPSICTQTYIVYGSFDSKKEAENLANFMKTKFFHFLLGQLKNTQQMSPTMFKLVPLLDYKEQWDDKKLYDKYKFSDDEIEFINSTIWPKK